MGLNGFLFFFKLSYPIKWAKFASKFEELLQNLKTQVLIFKLIFQRFLFATNSLKSREMKMYFKCLMSYVVLLRR